MNALLVAVLAFFCVFAAAFVGLYLRSVLPEEHLQEQSTDLIKLGIGLIATLSAIVLGLLISSAKSSFDKVNDDLTQTATKTVLLDSTLKHYGAQANDARGQLKNVYGNLVTLLFAENGSGQGKLDTPFALAQTESLRKALLQLSPSDDTQRWLKARALEIFTELSTERWLLMLQRESSISIPFLVVLLFWLSVIFMAFGLLAPRNVTVVATLLVCGLSVAGAIFLLLELDQPLNGLMKVSGEPMRQALRHLGK